MDPRRISKREYEGRSRPETDVDGSEIAGSKQPFAGDSNTCMIHALITSLRCESITQIFWIGSKVGKSFRQGPLRETLRRLRFAVTFAE